MKLKDLSLLMSIFIEILNYILYLFVNYDA